MQSAVSMVQGFIQAIWLLPMSDTGLKLYPLQSAPCSSVLFCLGLLASQDPSAWSLCPIDQIEEFLEASDVVVGGQGLASMPALELHLLHHLTSPQPLEPGYACSSR